MELAKKYNPADAEKKWYSHWLDKGYFHSTPDKRESYTIVIPPPNVTGVLHMGHMLNNTLQDVMIRRARMMGYNACWVPGTDHASIATEAKVVAKLSDDGIKKSDLTREEFLSHAFHWKDKHGNIILEQLKKLGASCDWERTKFTMDEDLSKSVISVFIDLYEKGHIYRGIRMVNWDPEGKTALADDEVIYREVDSQLYYIKYKIKETNDSLTIATTRPETLLGDTAVCINPNDNRFKKYKGKKKLIGICLGYQQILFNEKGKIIQQKNIYHGYQSIVRVTKESKLFKKDKNFKVGRYHSLKLFEPFKSNNIKISMRCAKTGIPMGIEDLKNNIYGFQFHPESFLTENGNTIIKKILSA